MHHAPVRSTPDTMRITFLAGFTGLVAAVVMAVAATTVTPNVVEARAAFTQQTGFACTKCHTAPPALTSYGKAFKAAGNKPPKN